jgi:NADH-ubiquinone oxidoreductase chain 6
MINIISFLVLCASIFTITSYSPVTSVVYLITTFLLTSIYLVLQNIVYLGFTYIIVYVGAVIVLLLFVIIIINLSTEILRTPFTKNIPLSLVVISLYTIIIISFTEDRGPLMTNLIQNITTLFTSSLLNHVDVSTSYANSHFWSLLELSQLQTIGFSLYTNQAIWLIVISIVLILSIIGPIVICAAPRLIILYPRSQGLSIMIILF